MAVYIILAILTCIMAVMVEQNNGIAVSENSTFALTNATRQQVKNKSLIAMIFLALFGVSACRIAIGHDYWEYTDIFNLIEQGRYVSTVYASKTTAVSPAGTSTVPSNGTRASWLSTSRVPLVFANSS